MSIDPKKFEEKNKKMFAWVSNYYDNHLFKNFYFEKIYQRVIEEIAGKEKNYFEKPINFLDVACGTGRIIHILSQKFPESKFVGLDFSEAMLHEATKKQPKTNNVQYKVGNVTKLPADANAYDLVICTEAFHHFMFPDETLKEIYRVLKPGGMFLLIDPAFNVSLIKKTVGLFLKWLENAYDYYSHSQMEALLKKHNFDIQKSYTYYLNNYFFSKKR